MAGNFLSRTLLSLVMDKNARKKYEALREAKKNPQKVAELKDEPAPPADAPAGDLDALPETLIRQAIDAAADELDRKKRLPPGRQALIEQALAVHDEKKKLLDDLPQAQREKLMVMAMHAFGADMDKAAGTGKPSKTRRTGKKS